MLMNVSLKPPLFVSGLVALVSLACIIQLGPTPAPSPLPPPTRSEAPVQPTSTPQPPPSGGLKTFTDKNNLYQIDLPADWTYEHTVDKTNNYYYIDTFTSPDEAALIENIVYDDGTAFVGKDKARFALYLLNTFYSKTGKEGDIRVSDDRIMSDGSERLVWSSRGGGYSGISFLETRGATTFLFFTVEWADSAKDQYMDILNAVIESYRLP